MNKQKTEDSAFEKIQSSITEGLRHRLGDPVLSVFSISFIIWNYEIPLFLFSDLSPDTKIYEIEHVLHKLNTFIVPVCASLTILIVLPFLFIRIFGIYDLVENNRIAHENIKIRAENKLLPHQLELKEAQRRIAEEIQRTTDARDVISEKDKENGKLSAHILNLEKKYQELETRLKTDEQKKSPEAGISKAVNFLARNGLTKLFNEVAAKSTIAIQSVTSLEPTSVVKMTSQDLVEIQFTGSSNILVLTDLGRRVHKYLLEQGN